MAPTATPSPAPGPAGLRPFLLFAVLLAALLAWLFRDSFQPDLALFANDGPLGAVTSRVGGFPQCWLGMWSDLNWLGFDGGSMPLSWNYLLLAIAGPRAFINFAPALASMLLGLSAYAFGRSSGWRQPVAAIVGVAAALNSDFFSYACWGLSTLTTCVASVFFSLAALQWKPLPRWLRCAIAGAALGHALMEGFDNGAIFSLYVAAFAMAQSWFQPGPVAQRLGRGALTTLGIAVASAVVAAQILTSLIQTNIASAAGMGQDKESTAARWNFATQWSLPPKEALRAVIPGLFGYRMDTAGGGQYWGKVGMDPQWDDYWASPNQKSTPRPEATLRYSGAGHYTGVPVVLFALFALVRSLRRDGTGLNDTERRWVWFWAGAALVSLLFAFGRFAPFYRLLYALPYFNTIRNPVKFLHPLNISLVILCGYGLQAWWLSFVERTGVRSQSAGESLRAAWHSPVDIDRIGSRAAFALCGLAVAGWLVYGASGDALLRHLKEVGFDASTAAAIARFSRNEVSVFLLILTTSVLLVLLGIGGWFRGDRARWTVLAVGALVALDLVRANVPWILHYNWRERYASNPLIEHLRRAPHEGRVAGRLPFSLPGQAGQALETMGSVYSLEWHQNQFRFYDIQSLEVVQLARPPADYLGWQSALRMNPLRLWQLSNTRYLFGLVPLVEGLNQQLDPQAKRFRLHTAFSLAQSETGIIRVETNAAGPFALIEFAGALPRAALYDQWRSGIPDDQATQLLASTNFNPETEVLVSDQIPAPAVTTATQPAGSAVYQSYSPTRFAIATDARTPCVLLVNDRYSADWKARVDGKEETVLRANYAVRGVYLAPGKHTVEFVYSPPVKAVYFSAFSILAAVALALYGVLLAKRHPSDIKCLP